MFFESRFRFFFQIHTGQLHKSIHNIGNICLDVYNIMYHKIIPQQDLLLCLSTSWSASEFPKPISFSTPRPRQDIYEHEAIDLKPQTTGPLCYIVDECNIKQIVYQDNNMWVIRARQLVTSLFLSYK